MNQMFHIFSEGENVLFRDDSDYIFFNNKFASSCYAMRLQPLAETTMSTHFHSMTESADESAIDELFHKLRVAYSRHYSSKYGQPLGNAFRISKLEITGVESIKNEMLYIMKNPVHHYVSFYPLEYPYSSAFYMFMDKLMPPCSLASLSSHHKKISEITARLRRQILSTDSVPDSWQISDSGMILPSSYINLPKARAFWNNNVKSFLFDINKNQTDARKEIISSDLLDIRTSGLSDIAVCRIIDLFAADAGRKSFHFLSPSEIQTLTRILKLKGCIDLQIRRCLWL